MSRRIPIRPAFSIVELLVVISILGMLVSVLLPAVQRARETARQADCSSRLRQIGLALLNYESAHRQLPSGSNWGSNWMIETLRFSEGQNIVDYMEYEFDGDYGDPRYDFKVPQLTCPSDSNAGSPIYSTHGAPWHFASYCGIAGRNQIVADGTFYGESRTRLRDVRDGLSNTVAIGERPPSQPFSAQAIFVRWPESVNIVRTLGVKETWPRSPYGPDPNCGARFRFFQSGSYDQECSMFHYWSTHSGGAQFLRLDGSVQFFSYDAPDILVPLSTINGGEVSQRN